MRFAQAELLSAAPRVKTCSTQAEQPVVRSRAVREGDCPLLILSDTGYHFCMSETTSNTNTPNKRSSQLTRTLLTAAAIGIIGAVLISVSTSLELPAMAISPVLATPLLGLYMFTPVVALALLRKPGVGLFASLVAGLAAMPFTGFIFFVPLGSVICGLLAEAPIAVSRYRRWQWWRYVIAAVLEGAIMLLIHWTIWHIDAMVVGMQIAMVVGILGSEIVWTFIALAVVRGLNRAGVGAQSASQAG